MKSATATGVEDICRKFGNDRTRMMDIVIAVQRRFGCVSTDSMEVIARACGTQRVEVESVVPFYAFLSVKPQGRVVIRLCNDIVDWMKGYTAVADAMAKELGVTMGETTAVTSSARMRSMTPRPSHSSSGGSLVQSNRMSMRRTSSTIRRPSSP